MKVTYNKIVYEFPDGATLDRIVGTQLIGSISHLWLNGKPVKKPEASKIVVHDGDVVRVQRTTAGG